MHTGPVLRRTHHGGFIRQLAFVCVIVLVLIGIGLIARHTDRDLTPSPASGSERAAIPEMPDVKELSVEELSILSDQILLRATDFDPNITDPFWSNNPINLLQPDENEPNLPLLRRTPCGADYPVCRPTASSGPAENIQGDPNDAPQGIDEQPVVLRTPYAVPEPNREPAATQPPAAVQPADPNDDTQTTSEPDVNSTADTAVRPPAEDKTRPPAKKEPLKIRTKIEYVETVLKKADFEPHQANGQTEGLQISGLEAIPVAKDLGLKNGDIIRTINEQQLSSPRQAYAIFKKAKKQPTMKVDLLRDGVPEALVFIFR